MPAAAIAVPAALPGGAALSGDNPTVDSNVITLTLVSQGLNGNDAGHWVYPPVEVTQPGEQE